MEIKQINHSQKQEKNGNKRPESFETFIGQEHIKKTLQAATRSALQTGKPLGHIILSGPSGFGKTTLAQILSHQTERKIHMITGYAVSKPADVISVLTTIQTNDIVFIDEIHRLPGKIQEMLYIAMEDFAIDMIMPDGANVRLPLENFTLVWATTLPDRLAKPLKNRFIYTCQFVDYTTQEKQQVVQRYLEHYEVSYIPEIIENIAKKVDTVPREIHNLCVKIKDFLVSHHLPLDINYDTRKSCEHRLQIEDWWLTAIHKKYLSILQSKDHPMGIKTIALQLGVNQQTVEEEIEPLLIKLGKIEKTTRGRKIA